MRTRLRVLVVLAALSALVAAALPAAGSSGSASATLSAELGDWLASAPAADTTEVIVTFDAHADTGLLAGLDVTATTLSHLPIALARLTPAQVDEVASWPQVRSLWHDEPNELHLAESVPLTGADRVWAGDGLRSPYTGAGVGVAVIDTGVDGLHPDLPAGAKVEGYALAGSPFDEEQVVFVESPTGDTYGHGTHVSSTVAGLGTASGGDYTGMAPGARIYSFKTDAGAVLVTSYALAAFDWILEHHEEKGIRVSTNSWGGGAGEDYDPDNPVNVATKALYDAGVTVIFSAGNSGGPDTLNRYATSPWVVGVAAGTKDVELADFSSRGRIDGNWDRRSAQATDTGLYRPGLTAPGVDIVAAKSSHAVVMGGGTQVDNPFYTMASGTSMSAPHVAGAVALMLEARPSLRPDHVVSILEGTASDMPAYELFETGTGHLDAHAAVRAAERGRVRFPPHTGGRTPTYTLAERHDFSGTVLPATWDLQRCPDDTGLLNHHTFDVGASADALYTEIEWALATDLVYLVLYDPDCAEAGVSAALLDIGAVDHRALLVTNPDPGTWTVAVYGRVNLPTAYTGAFELYEQN